MRAVFSLWTGTPSFTPNYYEGLVATLAVSLANRHMPIDMHTDDMGFELVKAFGWKFQAVYRTLNFIPDDAPGEVWAFGKLFTLSRAQIPTIHIDLDVLLHRPLPERLTAGVLLAQSVDMPHYYNSPDIDACLKVCEMQYEGRAFNAGIIGGGDVALLNRYAKEAMELAYRFKGLGMDPTAASMVVEQFYLGRFAKEHSVKVETLFKGIPTEPQAIELGYNHLYGVNKRDPYYVDLVLRRLQKDFPEELARFQDGWNHLEDLIIPRDHTSFMPACP